MSQKDLDAAVDRLLQARETINWAYSALNDPASHLGNYDLTPDEKEVLLRVMHIHLTEIHTTGANEIGIAPPIPPSNPDNEERTSKIPSYDPDQDDTV